MQGKCLFAVALAVGLTGLLAACGSYTQTTSGSKYLSGYGTSASDSGADGALPQAGTATAYSGPAGVIDAEIAAAAAVEPQLRFPARLGLARIDQGGLAPIPAAEAAAWQALAQRLGSGYGEFVPVSPLIAALAAPAPAPSKGMADFRTDTWNHYRKSLAQVVQEVRLGAARQHLDAVLIYETFGESSERSNALAVTKLALIGFFLPTEGVEAEGAAQAVLVDVRNGYTYGSASAVSEKPSHRLTTVSDSADAHGIARQEAQARAVENLTGEVETLVRDLRLALAEQRQAPGAQ